MKLKTSANPQSHSPETIERYSRSAIDATRAASARGLASLEVLQSLCLQALKDILDCKPDQAWMTIGTASRLLFCRAIVGDESLDIAADKDLDLRCRWSVFILEKVFSPHTCTSSTLVEGVDYPQSAPLPPPAAITGGGDQVPDLYNSDDAVTDFGIIAYRIQLISLWGDLAAWIHDIKSGKPESPWLPDSNHAKLSAKYFEFERHLPHKHLLRNLSFTKRSTDEILRQREYWVPWVTKQVLLHGIPAIINHPFIHLVALRRGSKGPQPPAFLQQTIDLTLFHSSWVFRLLKCCEEHGLEISDPLVGHIVAVLAVVPWLFQFALDEKVAQTASKNRVWCNGYLARASRLWPHISQKVKPISEELS
jgi:hypothetical protein